MQTKQVLLGTIAYFVILFVCSGISQTLPWGVPSTHSIRAASPSTVREFGATNVHAVPPQTYTTEAFDEEMVDRVSVLMTDRTFSWIVTKPLSAYNPSLYMAWEAVTQLGVALVLSLLLGLTRSLTLGSRVLMIVMAGIAASLATYGQLLNWWGLPPLYAVGVGVNLVLAWVIGAAIVGRFIIKSTPDAVATT